MEGHFKKKSSAIGVNEKDAQERKSGNWRCFNGMKVL